MMAKEEYFNVGYIARTHGLQGEVTISLLPGSPDVSAATTLFIQRQGQYIPQFVERWSAKGTLAYVKFEDVNDATAAGLLKGCGLFIRKKDRPKAEKGTFYGDEVLGFQVETAESTPLGPVSSAVLSGPNPHLMIRLATKEIMVPINGPFIQSVNRSKKRITVDLPDGFLDI